MYAVAVLDDEALAVFRNTHPWLDFPEDICEVSLYLDDNRAPTRLAALKRDANGVRLAADVDAFGSEAILALVRYAPQMQSAMEKPPEEAFIWSILEDLPVAGGRLSAADVADERRLRLEEAYQIARRIAAEQFGMLIRSGVGRHANARLEDLVSQVPLTLDGVDESHKSVFLEVDLWRIVAVLRDEYLLPLDQDISGRDDLRDYTRLQQERAETGAMSDPVLRTLLDLSPVAFAISTIGLKTSRYVRVNQAYLDLVGQSWDEIRGHEMVSSGVVPDSAAREYRLMLLDRDGGYDGQAGVVRTTAGEIIPVTISARRLFLSGQFYDFEVLTRGDAS